MEQATNTIIGGAFERSRSSASPIQRLFLPVDTSAASAVALDVCIVRARALSAKVILLALLPAASEYAGEGAVASVLRDILLPAQAAVEAADLDVERHALRGPNHAAALRLRVWPHRSSAAVVLNSPSSVRGPLQVLTNAIIASPPCSILSLPPLRGSSAVTGLAYSQWLRRRAPGQSI
jgi:hypothetical protein